MNKFADPDILVHGKFAKIFSLNFLLKDEKEKNQSQMEYTMYYLNTDDLFVKIFLSNDVYGHVRAIDLR